MRDRRGVPQLLRISYDADADFLLALVPGETIDGHLQDETEVFAALVDAESGEVEEIGWLYTRGPDGPPIGFGIDGAFAWDLQPELTDDDVPIWDDPRYDVPTLALRDATIGEILLAARATLSGSTPDVVFFDLAVEAGQGGRWEEAEAHWRRCLETGEMKAHYGLGYGLVELGRPREALGHLAMYTEICPRNAWAWVWRGRAAEAIGEPADAAACFRRALECEAGGSYETDARERLGALGPHGSDDGS